jgi:hypothetical protein
MYWYVRLCKYVWLVGMYCNVVECKERCGNGNGNCTGDGMYAGNGNVNVKLHGSVYGDSNGNGTGNECNVM